MDLTRIISYFRPSGRQFRWRLLACLLWVGLIPNLLAAQQSDLSKDKMQSINPRIAAPFEIDLDRVAAHGIRVIDGEHLTLFTDTQQRIDVEQLPMVFDLAVEQWCSCLSIDPARTKHWKMRAYVIENKERFENAGLFPNTLPPFPAGFQFGRDMWVYIQPGDYYTRHLLLHEGTHAFMEWFLDGWGSPWYSEGTAEKLALHQWNGARSGATASQPELKLDFAVTSKLQVPYWGRINLIRKDLEQGQGLSLQQVLSLPPTAFRDVRYYGWAWAACEFLSHHELARNAFAEFKQHVSQGQARFDDNVFKSLRSHFVTLERDWSLFIGEIDFGSDVSRVVLKEALEAKSTGISRAFRVDSARAWQVTSLQVKPGDRFRIRCNSRFQVGTTQKNGQSLPWLSTADGITLEYYEGRPVGILVAATLNEGATSPIEQVASLFKADPIGVDGLFEAKVAGRLCLRINESPAKMKDNQGALEVEIDKVK